MKNDPRQEEPREKETDILMPNEDGCLMCGSCCGPYFSLYVGETDEEAWAASGRQDLLDILEWERDRVAWDERGPYDSETGERLEKCRFLEKLPDGRALCGIHEAKPKICRDYPPGSSELCALFGKPPRGGGDSSGSGGASGGG